MKPSAVIPATAVMHAAGVHRAAVAPAVHSASAVRTAALAIHRLSDRRKQDCAGGQSERHRAGEEIAIFHEGHPES